MVVIHATHNVDKMLAGVAVSQSVRLNFTPLKFQAFTDVVYTLLEMRRTSSSIILILVNESMHSGGRKF